MALRVGSRYLVPAGLVTGLPIRARVPFERQLLTQWCWAACFAMVLRQRQCETARPLCSGDPCDGDGTGCLANGPVLGPANPGCNTVATQSQISERWSTELRRTIEVQGVIPESDLIQALGAGHVVQVWWAQGPARHVALIVGHENGQYLVHDPCTGVKTRTYREIKHVDNVRTWLGTWIL